MKLIIIILLFALPIIAIFNMLRRKNDILLKGAFEECFADFLQFFFPDADTLFNLEKGFEFMDKELLEITPDLRQSGGSRYSDLLVKTWLQNGQEEWILVHLEIQEQNDETFARRMFTYYYRILDRYNVPITAFAIFTGNKNQQQPATFERSFLGTEIVYRYNTYQIFDHTDVALLAMNNRFALIMLAAQKARLAGKIPEEELGKQRITIAKALIESRQYNYDQIRFFIRFLKNFVHIGSLEINTNFDRQIDLLTANPSIMGLAEALKYIDREEGREEGELRKTEIFVINLIQQMGFSNEQIARLADTDINFVKEIRKRFKLEQ